METKENNKLIAEFMGEEIGHEKMVIYNNTWTIPKYESSWDWLMPVVGKINRRDYRGIGVDLQESIATCLIEPDIDRTYKCVVEFIKWYNENL